MKGQIIKAIFTPETIHEWYILETDLGKYELVLGGFRPTNQISSVKRKIDLSITGEEIINIKTDDFALYLELQHGGCLVHSESFIHGNGETSFNLRYWNNKEFEKVRREWYEQDQGLKEIQ